MKSLTLPALILLLAITVIGSLCFGKYHIPVSELSTFATDKLFGGGVLPSAQLALLENIIFDIRLPRILAAIVIGAALAVSGTAFQALFINPLVSPGLLGVLAGASFGAALGMLLAKSWLMVEISTLVFGFIAVGVATGIARIYHGNSLLMLVLGGIISGSFFTALLSIVKYVSDPSDKLPAIVYWLMGNLAAVDRETILVTSLPTAIAIVIILFYGRQLNILSMGDEEALSLGISVRRTRLIIIFLATLISALTVMLAGMIGWVGLIIPHICRMIVGPNNEKLLPTAALIGAIYLILVDDVSRLLFSFEVPIGILTSLIGIPFFTVVLKNANRGWR